MSRKNGTQWLQCMVFALVSTLLFTVSSCTIQPPLHLPDEEGTPIETNIPMVKLDLDVLWKYDLAVDPETGEVYDTTYNWRDEFYYGWDTEDDRLFGTWEIKDPDVFNIRRYWTEDDPDGAHKAPYVHQIDGSWLIAQYKIGYYDILAWNEVTTLDGVQSLHFDESSTYEYVTAYTNQSMVPANKRSRQSYAYYQPEFLFGGYYEDLKITDDPADYDYFDTSKNVYVKYVNMTLTPRTYIYVTQIILHNNRGRVVGIDGSANLEGMASKTNVNTGVTNEEPISVNYSQRMKKNVDMKGEKVDVIGGRLFTFGLCGMYPYNATEAKARKVTTRNYIDVDMMFTNGIDSTFIFDVTDQIHKRFKGGILTVELDMDTVKIPSLPGGSGFDAVVEDYDSVQYEFEMAKKRQVRVASPSSVSQLGSTSRSRVSQAGSTSRSRVSQLGSKPQASRGSTPRSSQLRVSRPGRDITSASRSSAVSVTNKEKINNKNKIIQNRKKNKTQTKRT